MNARIPNLELLLYKAQQALAHDLDYPICVDNQWYFEGVEVKKTAKKAQLSSVIKEGD